MAEREYVANWWNVFEVTRTTETVESSKFVAQADDHETAKQIAKALNEANNL